MRRSAFAYTGPHHLVLQHLACHLRRIFSSCCSSHAMYNAKFGQLTTRMATPSQEHCRRTPTQTAGIKVPVLAASSSRMRRKLTTEHGMTHLLMLALV